MTDKVSIRRLPTGVPGLDAVLGGGVPEFSFNVIAGTPGAGKTTLVQQVMFALARADRPALFFTVLGEPALKMLRYQQQFAFFDVAKVNASVRFINLATEALAGGLDDVLKRIVQGVEAASPGIVVVDSFRSVMQSTQQQNGPHNVQHFIQELGMRLTGWQATTFLVGEFQLAETDNHPIFTVADGLVWVYQSLDRNSMVRKMHVMKMRGQAPIPGLHTFRITNHGIQVFPRLIGPPEAPAVGGAGRPEPRAPQAHLRCGGVAPIHRGDGPRDLSTGEIIFSQGDVPNSVLYLLEGGVKLSVLSCSGKEAVVAMLEAGFFGESALADLPVRRETATAMMATTRVLVIPKPQMIQLLHEQHAFSDVFIAHMLARNSRIEEDVVDQLLNSSEKRLARALLLLARRRTPGQTHRVLPKISQQTLADMVGTTRSRVNLFMKRFKKLGYIDYSNGLKVNDSLLRVVLRDERVRTHPQRRRSA